MTIVICSFRKLHYFRSSKHKNVHLLLTHRDTSSLFPSESTYDSANTFFSFTSPFIVTDVQSRPKIKIFSTNISHTMGDVVFG